MKKILNQLLVKPAGPDCNMACEYCFYRPKAGLYPESPYHRMDDAILAETISQVMEGGEREISFSWQGGEPTLMGLDFFRRVTDLQARHGRGTTVGNGLQTNGLLIDAEWAEFLHAYRFLVGLSIDGPRHVHDRYRRFASGGSSFDRAVDASGTLLGRGVAVNALSVVTDYSSGFPGEIYGFLKEIGLTHMQFIPCVEADPERSGRAAPCSVTPEDYGRFLCAMFDLWLADFTGGAPATSIRLFESLLFSYAGFTPPECGLMEECGVYLVVEHNGDVYPCDFFVERDLKLGNVMNGRLEEMLNSTVQADFGMVKKRLPPECAGCPWLERCRGGCVKDRIRDPSDRGMNHFCGAFRMFFSHADTRLRRIAAEWRANQASAESAPLPRTRQAGRNDPCPCGSGLKYKKCCGRNV